jgi:hypothetical protein
MNIKHNQEVSLSLEQDALHIDQHVMSRSQALIAEIEAFAADIEEKRGVIEKKELAIYEVFEHIKNARAAQGDVDPLETFKKTAAQFKEGSAALLVEMEKYKMQIAGMQNEVLPEGVSPENFNKGAQSLLQFLRQYVRKIKKNFTVSFSQINIFFDNNYVKLVYLKNHIEQLKAQQKQK